MPTFTKIVAAFTADLRTAGLDVFTEHDHDFPYEVRIDVLGNEAAIERGRGILQRYEDERQLVQLDGLEIVGTQASWDLCDFRQFKNQKLAFQRSTFCEC
jgi:hypothetical protein